MRQVPIVFCLILLSVAAPGLFGQTDAERRLAELEAKVERLTADNESLRAQVQELSDAQLAGGEQKSLDLEEAIKTLESGNREAALLGSANAALSRLRIGGQWRTRADIRSNNDLLDELDDDGFRLDYRFNLGFGFELTTPQPAGEESRRDFKVRTWFELQSAGRAANNTSENLGSSIGATVEDFATRDDALDIVRLYQAYIALENIFEISALNLKVGRQEIVLGSGLIMGTNEFFTGFVHDAVKLDFYIDPLEMKVQTFYAKEAAPDGLLQPGLSTGGLTAGRFRASGDEDELIGLYTTLEALNPFIIDLYYFYFNGRNAGDGVRPENTTAPGDSGIDAFGRTLIEGHIHTVGTWLHQEDFLGVEGLYFSLEAAYQLGETAFADESATPGNDFVGENLDAFLVEFRPEYRLPTETEIRIYAGYYFSEGPDDDAESGFTPFFISRHSNTLTGDHGPYSRFGNIDLVPSTNVHVVHFGVKFKPDTDWTVGATYLFAWLNHPPTGAVGTGELNDEPPFTVNGLGTVYTDSQALGHEIDLYAEYKYSKHTSMFFNVSVFLPETDFEIDRVAAPTSASSSFDAQPAVAAYIQLLIQF